MKKLLNNWRLYVGVVVLGAVVLAIPMIFQPSQEVPIVFKYSPGPMMEVMPPAAAGEAARDVCAEIFEWMKTVGQGMIGLGTLAGGVRSLMLAITKKKKRRSHARSK